MAPFACLRRSEASASRRQVCCLAASADALLLFVPVAGDAPASSSPWPPSEGRDWRGRKTMEEIMRVLTIFELMRLSRIELCGLLRRSPTCCRTSPKAPPNAKPRTSTCGTSGPFWPGATSRPSETAPLPVFTGGGICRSRDSGKLIALLASCLAARPKQSCRASSDDL
jgi:hypothetical protein